ncbi:MAG: 1-acyl-sn-glycerol-3-phosphate acyltransferase [Paludibacteraceae bacterium]|nr:1-acyl-sn-glycerol-3-phosphate acyltransferase [Paludibacteraceae bacterium]
MHIRPLYHYIRLVHNNYYSRIDIEGKENIPDQSDAVIIAANHQNAINDPLALEFVFSNRIINLFAHGNLFNNKFFNWFFRSIHVIPAYRMRTDGEESLSKNFNEFAEVEDKLFKGEWAGIFPEATNMTGHWLGEFSLGYMRMAFAAAEKQNFEKDVKILPVSIHYDNYHRFRHKLLVRISPAVSLSQFYELYKTKPRTAQRNANALVRESIERNMLNVKDLENYEAIDYLRNTYGIKYCAAHGKYYRTLTYKLDTDQSFVKEIETASERKPEKIKDLYAKALELKALTKNAGLRDWVLTNRMSKTWLIIYALAFIITFPLFIFALIPNIIAYIAPIPLCRKFDKIGGTFAMYKGGVQMILNALVVLPIIHLAPFIVMMCMATTLMQYALALTWFGFQPWLLVFGWTYYNDLRKYISLLRFRHIKNTAPIQQILQKRSALWNELDKLFSKTL